MTLKRAVKYVLAPKKAISTFFALEWTLLHILTDSQEETLARVLAPRGQFFMILAAIGATWCGLQTGGHFSMRFGSQEGSLELFLLLSGHLSMNFGSQ